MTNLESKGMVYFSASQTITLTKKKGVKLGRATKIKTTWAIGSCLRRDDDLVYVLCALRGRWAREEVPVRTLHRAGDVQHKQRRVLRQSFPNGSQGDSSPVVERCQPRMKGGTPDFVGPPSPKHVAKRSAFNSTFVKGKDVVHFLSYSSANTQKVLLVTLFE